MVDGMRGYARKGPVYCVSTRGLRRAPAAIEAGDPAVSIGNVFNAADILGVPLFGAEDRAELSRLRREGRDRLALLPTRVDRPRKKAQPDDDF